MATALQGTVLLRDVFARLWKPQQRAHAGLGSRCHSAPSEGLSAGSSASRRQPAPLRARPQPGSAPDTAPCRPGLPADSSDTDTAAAGNARLSPTRKRGRRCPRAASRCPTAGSDAFPPPRAPYRAAAAPAGAGRPPGAARRCPALSRAIPRSRGRTPPPQPWSPPPSEPECASRAPLPVFSPARGEGGVRAGGGGRARSGRAPLTAALAPPPTLKRPRRARRSGAPWRRREEQPGPGRGDPRVSRLAAPPARACRAEPSQAKPSHRFYRGAFHLLEAE